jgi:hypothetical protein
MGENLFPSITLIVLISDFHISPDVSDKSAICVFKSSELTLLYMCSTVLLIHIVYSSNWEKQQFELIHDSKCYENSQI